MEFVELSTDQHTVEEEDGEAFLELLWDKIDRTIEDKDEYHNGTGYFNGLEHANIGDEPVKMVDKHGRKVVAIPVPEKDQNYPVFQRYSDDESTIVAGSECRWDKVPEDLIHAEDIQQIAEHFGI